MKMSVHLKIEDGREGFLATLSQRDDVGKMIGRPAVFAVSSRKEAKQHAKALARSLGLKAYGVIDKTAAGNAATSPQDDRGEIAGSDTDHPHAEEVRPPWSVPGVVKSL